MRLWPPRGTGKCPAPQSSAASPISRTLLTISWLNNLVSIMCIPKRWRRKTSRQSGAGKPRRGERSGGGARGICLNPEIEERQPHQIQGRRVLLHNGYYFGPSGCRFRVISLKKASSFAKFSPRRSSRQGPDVFRGRCKIDTRWTVLFSAGAMSGRPARRTSTTATLLPINPRGSAGVCHQAACCSVRMVRLGR